MSGGEASSDRVQEAAASQAKEKCRSEGLAGSVAPEKAGAGIKAHTSGRKNEMPK
jgi:hypothetical protein